MTVKDLIIRLLDCNPSSEVVCSCENGILDTNAVVDNVEEQFLDEESMRGIVDLRIGFPSNKNTVVLSSFVEASYVCK